MIIIEGPDLAGKSTIGKRITNLTDREVHHYGGPPTNAKSINNRISHSIKHPEKIFDRHSAVSERVYGPLRGFELMEPEQLDSVLTSLNPLILFCDPGLDFLLNNIKYLKTKPHKEKEHVDKVKENYLKVYNSYQFVMSHLSTFLTVKRVDFRKIKDKQLKAFLKEEK